jgi:serine/threonine protein kinase/Flp pilus assembly protein TadD
MNRDAPTQRLDVSEAPSDCQVQDEQPGFLTARSLKRELLAEQQAAWDEGRPVAPESLLHRWPTDPTGDPDVASLLFEDFQRRRLDGEQPSVEEYDQRFPEHKDSLASLLARDAVLRSVGGASGSSGSLLGLPEVGDELFGFRLLQELGRGAFARVYLAEQKELAGRPVVLKVSAIEGSEPQTLAQLQHTHIVPIYSVHEDARAGLRAVCMPYFGGASLSRVLQRLWDEETAPWHGNQLVAALHAVAGSSAGTGIKQESAECTTLAVLSPQSYIRAAVWLVARLAEALQHAHQRGILHRDIKPSNVLLSAEGEPLLLDFNLAQQHGQQAQATLGGTVAYMAPEHLRALMARSKALANQVDERSDLYSLGMVLYEMLTGHNPFDQSASYSVLPMVLEAMIVERSRSAPSLRQRRPDAPWSLESILRKCLAPDPAQRYQKADHLADDLRRFLDDRPLCFAPELSGVERLQKWARRHPRLTSSASVATVAAVLLVATGGALFGLHHHLVNAREQLMTAQARVRKDRYEEATVKALCLVNTHADFQDQLSPGLALCEDALGQYGLLDGEQFTEPSDWNRLDSSERNRLAEDTRELLLLLASGRVRKAPKDPATLQQALALLDRAEAIGELAPCRALWLDRAYYLDLRGETTKAQEARLKADAIPAQSAHDHYLLATSLIVRGGQESLSEARAELDQALALNPRFYWALVERGICHEDLGESVLAAGDFGACITLWPEFASGYFNRGQLLLRTGQSARAILDFTAALDREPTFLPAHWDRGLARLELEQFGAALSDFDQAQRLGRADALLHLERGVALEGLHRFVEADRAFEAAFVHLDGVSAEVRAQVQLHYGLAVKERRPERARPMFEAVVHEERWRALALFGLAGLALAEEKTPEALELLNQALAAEGELLEARRCRSLVLARKGNLAEAMQDINFCLKRKPSAGNMLYAAACVSALMVKQFPEPRLVKQTLDLLRRAFAQGYGKATAAEDPDLAVLRSLAAFRLLCNPAEESSARNRQ